MDIIIAAICCYQLYRMSVDKGLPPWHYVIRYIGLFLLAGFLAGYAAIMFFGIDVVKTEEGRQNLLYLEPFILLFEFLLFLYYRKKINNSDLYKDDNSDDTPPTSGEKKDLSYFR